MFYLTAKVGTMFAVYDDSDNTVEWHSKGELDKYVGMGILIQGYSVNGVQPVNNINIPYNCCNWTKSGKCIFSIAERATASGNFITITAEGKKFKCKVLGQVGSCIAVKFSNGIMTSIPMVWLRNFGVLD